MITGINGDCKNGMIQCMLSFDAIHPCVGDFSTRPTTASVTTVRGKKALSYSVLFTFISTTLRYWHVLGTYLKQ
mgnify:CR=1 FL=1